MRDGNDAYVVNGTKTWISNGIHGQVFALLVKTDPAAEPRHKGMSMLLAEKGPGFRVSRKLEKIGYKGIDSAELIFEDYRVPADRPDRRRRRARPAARRWAGWSSAASTSRRAACGIAKAALDESVRYAQLRKTFGKPIAEHQAIQLKLAEMAIRTEAAHRADLQRGRRPTTRGERCDMEAGMAKYSPPRRRWRTRSKRCASTAPTAIPRSSTSSATTATRRCWCIGEGTNELQRIIIARQLVERNRI